MDEERLAELDGAQLRRALIRERKARVDAEKIAEQGLLDLHATNVELDARVRERTTQLEQARAEAEEANRAKSTFLASLSHELRTPLNGVIGMLELLDGAELSADEKRWLVSARQASDRLNRLFIRLLRFVELDGLERSTPAVHAPIQTIVDRALERWRLPCARKGQLLSAEVAVDAGRQIAWPSEIGSILDELLGNVVSHGDPGPVRLEAKPADGAEVEFSVTDVGPGISVDIEALDFLDHAGMTTMRADVGAALGLALVKRTVEHIGGSWGIEVEGVGSRVWVRLPNPADSDLSG